MKLKKINKYINCTPLSTLSFWLSFLFGMFGYNTLTKSLFSNFPMFLLLSKFVHVYSLLPHPLSLNSSQSTTHPQYTIQYLHLVQFNSVAQLCPTLCDPMNRSTPGLPVHHQLLEFTQTQRPSSWWCHPTISSSVIPFSSRLQSFLASGSFPLSQFFASGGQSIGVLLQHQSFQWIFRTDLL